MSGSDRMLNRQLIAGAGARPAWHGQFAPWCLLGLGRAGVASDWCWSRSRGARPGPGCRTDGQHPLGPAHSLEAPNATEHPPEHPPLQEPPLPRLAGTPAPRGQAAPPGSGSQAGTPCPLSAGLWGVCRGGDAASNRV